ncbi:alpha-ketoglutarate-dependent dioxygenase AlkB family protein [Archangium gephyra]|uniref:alpha-ketoglutarate-dependent dioxygenase AlkB family protein n=1 Tax=Archangium gephyra TaxID=48 RepID=UPI003B80FB8A
MAEQMFFDLFGASLSDINLLPCDGIVNDYGSALGPAEADALYERLLNQLPWRPDIAVVNGVATETARHALWYGDRPFRYMHSGIPRQAQPWPAGLLDDVKRLAEEVSQTRFNSCVLNLYHDGREGMTWHSDSEAAYGPHTAIASLSLGATRKFAFMHKRTRERRELMLRHGQFIVMRGETQRHWLHAVMKTFTVTSPRINLTFRTFDDGTGRAAF